MKVCDLCGENDVLFCEYCQADLCYDHVKNKDYHEPYCRWIENNGWGYMDDMPDYKG